MYCSSDFAAQSDVQAKLQALKLFDKVDNVDMGAAAPTLMTLQQYDAILVWADTSRGCSDPTNVGNVLAQYVDAGGGVVQILPYYVGNTYSNVSGDFYNRYALVGQSSMISARGLSMGTKVLTHPILDGINTLTTTGSTCYNRSKINTTDLRNSGAIAANWSDGSPILVVGSPGGHNRVELNMYVTSTDIGYNGCHDPKSDAYKLMGNSLIWVSNPLRANPNTANFGDVPSGTTSLPIDVQVVNTGKDSITLSSGTLGMTGEFSVTLLGGASFPMTLNAGDKFAFEATVRPSAPGSRSTSYTLTASTPGASNLVVPLVANGLGPVFKVQPPNINFGGMPSGGAARVTTVTVTNTGGGLLNLNSPPTLSDTTNFTLVTTPMTPVSLSAGASISFDVKFTPMSETRFSAYLNIPYNDGTAKTMQVPLAGSFGKPKISIPTSIVMTPVRVNQHGPEQGIIVTNTGLADLTISAVTFTGPNMGDFNAVTMPTTMNPVVVSAGSSTELKLQCVPTVQGLRQATYTITNDDPTNTMAPVSLTCNGVVANFDMAPNKIDFTPSQQTGQCSSPQTVTVTNSGTDNLRVLSVALSGANATSFQQPINMARIVASGGGQLQIPVSFCPVDIGAQTADLVITTDLTPGHTAKVPLTGTGTGPKVVANPGSIDFGPIYINTTSITKTIAITNEGDQVLTFGANTPPVAPFKVTGIPASGTSLKKGDPAIMLSVSVSPTMAMQVSGEIDMIVNDKVQMGVLKIPLSVVGTQADIAVQPMMMSFPLTIIGTSSPPQTVTVTNSGSAPLTGINVSFAGTNSSDFIANTGMIPTTVPTGQSFMYTVSFKPTSAGSRTAIMVVKAAGLTTPVQVKVDGTAKLLTITCMPDAKNFGNVSLGMDKMDKVTCSNSDSSSIDFVASFTDFSDDWTVDPMMATLDPAQGADTGLVTLNIDFHPTVTGPRTTTLNIKTKDGIAIGSVDLDGNGVPMPKDKAPMDQGCTYSGGRSTSPLTLGLLSLLLCGLFLRRRRYVA